MRLLNIADFLKLPDAINYTGHSFRRSSATFLTNKGVDVVGLKRHGGWKSSTVAESYVEDSIQNKKEFAQKILHDLVHDDISDSSTHLLTTTTSSAVSNASFSLKSSAMSTTDPVSITNCSNFSINFISNK